MTWHADDYTPPALCGRTMKKGGACTRPRLVTGFDTPQARQWFSCYNHQTVEERDAYLALRRAEEAEFEETVTADPVCWSWPSTAPEPEIPEGVSAAVARRLHDMQASSPEARAGVQLEQWHDGRCAICGGRSSLVEDHDHQTGLVRGLLCRGCNTREGSSYWASRTDTIYAKYRKRPPTAILGMVIRYWDPVLQDYAPALPPPPSRAQSRAENPWLLVQQRRRQE